MIVYFHKKIDLELETSVSVEGETRVPGGQPNFPQVHAWFGFLGDVVEF